MDVTNKARTLVEALPYIRAYRGATVVVKIGGEALEKPELARLVADDLALLTLVGLRLVLVHGGGPQVSRAMREAGTEARFVAGLRVTDESTLTIVRRVLVGTINVDLVARLCSAGLRAIGLSGADAGLMQAELVRGPGGEDLGRVGRISEVDGEVLQALLGHGLTPVVAPLARSADGGFVNVNADSVAGGLAGALRASKLVYLTNVDGLYSDLADAGSLVPELKRDELASMLPALSDGMQPKAASAIAALDAGVGKVHILDGRVEHALLLEVFTDEGIGTQVLA